MSKVELKHLDHEVLIHKDTQRAATTWCLEQWGQPWNVVDNRSGSWCCFWVCRDRYDHYRFCFADERDMLLFILRWG